MGRPSGPRPGPADVGGRGSWPRGAGGSMRRPGPGRLPSPGGSRGSGGLGLGGFGAHPAPPRLWGPRFGGIGGLGARLPSRGAGAGRGRPRGQGVPGGNRVASWRRRMGGLREGGRGQGRIGPCCGGALAQPASWREAMARPRGQSAPGPWPGCVAIRAGVPVEGRGRKAQPPREE